MGRKYILMSDNEPTDEELAMLMRKVAVEAKTKAAIAKRQMQERILLEIEKAETRYKASHT